MQASRQFARWVAGWAVVAAVLGVACQKMTEYDLGPDGVLDAARRATEAPGAAAAIVRCGDVTWSGGSGRTELGSAGLPVTAHTRFISASTAKLIIATLVMSFVDDGDLRLDQTIDDFFPALPGADAITIRMLLNHTSGLNEYFGDPAIEEKAESAPFSSWRRSEVLDAIRNIDSPPGEEFSYTNSNYIVLGGILEAVSGSRIEQLFVDRIREPLGLSEASSFRYEPRRSREFAHPHIDGRDGFVDGVMPSGYWGEVWTDGGLATTAEELALIGDGLSVGVLVEEGSVELMTADAESDGGLGVFTTTSSGVLWFGHDGSYGGYEAELWHDPDRRLTVAVMSNAEASAAEIWERLASSRSVNELESCS